MARTSSIALAGSPRLTKERKAVSAEKKKAEDDEDDERIKELEKLFAQQWFNKRMTEIDRRQTVSAQKMNFWHQLDILLQDHEIVIDRPRNSVHPRFAEVVFPNDYGYLKGTTGGNCDNLDVWLGTDPNREIVDIVCTCDARKKDLEIKLLMGCREREIETIRSFHNSGAMSADIVPRPSDDASGDPTFCLD